MADKVASSDTLDKPLFRDITADDYDPEITELESLCINCEEQGITRLLLTKIPFFREVILASFSCDHCGYRNAELQPGGQIQDRAVSYTLVVKTVKDLNRQIVQTEHATVKIEDLDFEVPPGKSALTTIEGIIDKAVDGIEQGQVLRRIQQPEVAQKIDDFLQKLRALKAMSKPFKLVIEDPSGNSFLENPFAPSKDPELIVHHYPRTKAQDEALGIFEQEGSADSTVGQDDGQGFNSQNEVLSFNTNCSNCGSPCETNMKVVNIPHFKEVVIMATVCDKCGSRDNEVKSGGGIEPLGVRLEVTIEEEVDLARDLLKSETSTLKIPDLEFETEMGTLGGKFTTVEGILEDIKNQLKESNPFFHGDSSQPDTSSKLKGFCNKLDQIIQLKRKGVKLILEDPTGNSYIQNICHPDPDPRLAVTRYERTFDENEALGLNDMKTDNYETS